MPPPERNRSTPDALTDQDVEAALSRISERDRAVGLDATHVYEALTWGEGPAMIDRTTVQDWLWYQLAAKYLTDDPDEKRRLAAAAATLFDELGLHGYASLCRSETTAAVHDAWDRSDAAGRTAMRKAVEASGIAPPDLDDHRWGSVMGMEEACAHADVGRALEDAIDAGELVVGGRAWRRRQRELAAAALDAEHPDLPGQTWRTAVLTERLSTWTAEPERRSPDLARLRSGFANRLLVPAEAPDGLRDDLAPLLWLLDAVGDEQALTQAGYLNTAFVRRSHEEGPWDDPFSMGRAPRTELDAIGLRRLRELAQRIGALRRRGRTLRRTTAGAAMARDPALAWRAVVEHPAPTPWDRFVLETAALVLLGGGGSAEPDEVAAAVASMAAEMGWRTGDHGGRVPPPPRRVQWDLADRMGEMELLGMLGRPGDFPHLRWELTSTGTVTLTAVLREAATGPRSSSW